VIDLHCHVLPGIDDGPATMDDAVALARGQEAAGVRIVAATPHVDWDWPDVDAARIRERVGALNAALREAGVAVEVVPGAEVALTRAASLDDDELRALRLGGGPWVLVEPPFTPAPPAGVAAALSALAVRGHQILIAHPERCPAFLRDRDALAGLVAGGMRCSITASSLTGRFGRDSQRVAHELMAAGLVHDVASDAHGAGRRRPPGLAGPMEEAGLGDQVAWYCEAAPRAILDGGALPPRPLAAEPVPPAGRGLRRRLRRA
jgi:protein-tyrosine phosphatase